VIRFGTFEADPASGELRKGGRRINLQEQPFHLLMLLLVHPGEVVTREELRQKLWGETYVDFEEGLNTRHPETAGGPGRLGGKSSLY
jgi:DNA-binding winged helix-turn-helix (wHTH) protein